jgi:hypothetical protein
MFRHPIKSVDGDLFDLFFQVWVFTPLITSRGISSLKGGEISSSRHIRGPIVSACERRPPRFIVIVGGMRRAIVEGIHGASFNEAIWRETRPVLMCLHIGDPEIQPMASQERP